MRIQTLFFLSTIPLWRCISQAHYIPLFIILKEACSLQKTNKMAPDSITAAPPSHAPQQNVPQPPKHLNNSLTFNIWLALLTVQMLEQIRKSIIRGLLIWEGEIHQYMRDLLVLSMARCFYCCSLSDCFSRVLGIAVIGYICATKPACAWVNNCSWGSTAERVFMPSCMPARRCCMASFATGLVSCGGGFWSYLIATSLKWLVNGLMNKQQAGRTNINGFNSFLPHPSVVHLAVFQESFNILCRSRICYEDALYKKQDEISWEQDTNGKNWEDHLFR